MEKKKFTFMETYFETVEELKKHDPQLASQLLEAIIQYGLYGIEPDDPLIKALMIQIQFMIDTGKEISQKNSENGKKGGRPKKSETQSETSETKANETEKNPKKANESEWKQKEKQKEKKEKEKINTLSSYEDNGASTEYGNEEVNECLNLIKSYNNGICNWTVKKSRQYATLLIAKIKKIDSVQNWTIKRQEVLKMILEVWKNDEYHSTKTTSPELIFYNLATLMEICRKQFKKQQGQKVFTAL